MTEDRERKKGELIDLMTAAALRGRPLKNATQTKPSVNIKGNANIVGNHNSVSYIVHTKPATKLNIIPGPQHITSAQAAEIKHLVNRIAKLQGTSHQQLWTTLGRKFNFPKYHLAEAARYDEIHAHLVAKLARTNAPKTRNTTLARIHAQAAKHPGGIEAVRAKAQQLFGTHRLSHLTDTQLTTLANTPI